MSLISGHQRAESAYFKEGVDLLELASRARELFQSQEPAEKRKLLNFVLSNSSWREGRLTASYRKPFDLISETAIEAAELAQTEPFTVDDGVVSENWRSIVDTFRTLLADSRSDQACGAGPRQAAIQA
ncbi:MAG: hypothetical protein DLM66_03675 [Candidatus Dormiibacter spiritus]|nr:MAG: hypothetical protein DLM66_03675 [Candidatus Dormibacteraeota bacterium]